VLTGTGNPGTGFLPNVCHHQAPVFFSSRACTLETVAMGMTMSAFSGTLPTVTKS
jgi:hypothetical protein